MSAEAPTNTEVPPAGEEKKISKKEANRLKKAEQKNAAKATNAAQKKQAQPVEEETSPNCGDLPMIRSAVPPATPRVFTDIEDLAEEKAEQTVLIRGRVYNSRSKGNLCFLVLRQRGFTVQGVLSKNDFVNKAMLKFAAGIQRESIVDVEGILKKATVELCSQKDVEIQVQRLFVVSRSAPTLPLMVEDAARPQPILDAQDKEIAEIDAQIAAAEAAGGENVAATIEELQKKKSTVMKFVNLSQDTRLDHRVIDLRAPANHAIFRIQSAVCRLWRELLTKENFVEIHTPKIMGAASEGGAAVFKLQYYESIHKSKEGVVYPQAFLAQSPQLHKQMAVCSDLERVFEIGPVFRAEDSQSVRHMTEFMGLDLEMAFKDHYHEVLDLIGRLFNGVFKGLQTECAKELAIINQQFPFEPLQLTEPMLRLEFPEGVKMLREAGVQIEDLADLSTLQEKELGRLVKEKYHTDLYALDKFPKVARPFYTMPDPNNPSYTNAYDIFVRGQEISSGAQRIHDYEMLIASAREYGVDPASIAPYAEAFKFGAPPHAGCGVGLERLVMLFLGVPNIRKTSLFPRTPTRLSP